jgi:murein DD-endopeptidase MepM/ murein hydrolase activator NlpD
MLYRTWVRLTQPMDMERLRQLEVVVLKEEPERALLLVDEEQLGTLARLRFMPDWTDELASLVMQHAAQKAWLPESLSPLLSQAASVPKRGEGDETARAEALAGLRVSMQALTAEQRAGIAALPSNDYDGDGLTDTQEQWWCTDPRNPNSDGDAFGYTDGVEVRALLDFTLPRNVRWAYGPPFGPPNAWPDFNGRDGNPATAACNDGDYDTIPDFAEAFMVGTNPLDENTDGDKYDDGQELFGVTYCPGADQSCGWGSFPRTEDYSFISSRMPSWVRPPGDSPFVAAYPVIELHVDPATVRIVTKEIRTIERTITQGEEIATGFAETDGQATTVGTIDTNTHSTWQENSTTEGGIAPGNLAQGPPSEDNRSFVLAPALLEVPGSDAAAAVQGNDGGVGSQPSPASSSESISAATGDCLYIDPVAPIFYRPVSKGIPVTAYFDLDPSSDGVTYWCGHHCEGRPASTWTNPANCQSYEHHTGTDYGVDEGSPVYASRAGTVTVSSTQCPLGAAYGTCVLIAHGVVDTHVYETLYAHLSKLLVQVGQSVGVGDKIAESGHTGTQDPHLHFEVRQDGIPICPYGNHIISDTPASHSPPVDVCRVSPMASDTPNPTTLPATKKETLFGEVVGWLYSLWPGKRTTQSGSWAREASTASTTLPGCGESTCVGQVGRRIDAPLNTSDNRSTGQCDQSPIYVDAGALGTGTSGSGTAINNNGDGTWDYLRVWSETRTSGEGYSTSHSELQSETNYREVTHSRINTLVSSEAWATATTMDPTDAAQLSFSYDLKNVGSDAALQLKDMDINLLIGELPVITWRAPDRSLILPAQTKGPFSGGPIKLSLEQLAAIDNGAPIRFVLADYGYADELYEHNAWGRSVLFHVDDGIGDGNRSEDTYLIATQLGSSETYQQTLARYFPVTVFDGGAGDPRTGTITNVRTPEYDSNGEISGWFDHLVNDHAWWEISISVEGETPGIEHFKDMPAKTRTDVFLRYRVDSDGDGYSDIAEVEAMTDPHDPDSHPGPAVIAAQHIASNGDAASVQLSLQNNGDFDASSVEVWAIAPDDSITLSDNLIGGGGRVRAGARVVLGARIGAPDLTGWKTSVAKPYLAGQFEGTAVKTFLFRADTAGTVGSTPGLTVSWSDSGSSWTPLSIGAGYGELTPLPVADGINIAFTAGAVSAGERFTATTALPSDTFAFTINRPDYTPPLLVVSYNDPQGNHKFTSDVQIAQMRQDLTHYHGAMRYGLQLDALSATRFEPGPNTTYFVFNNPSDTTILGAKLFVEFATPAGIVAKEYVLQNQTFLPGPNVLTLTWNTADFSPNFDPAEDYHILAFATDRQGTIIENTVKDLDELGQERLPAASVSISTWNFGMATQGEVLRHDFVVANTGSTDLLTYVSTPADIRPSSRLSGRVRPADVASYDLTFDTSSLPVGAYSQTINIRTSDPSNPTSLIRVIGTLTDESPTTRAVARHPLDLDLTIPGTHSAHDWVEFTHTLAPEPQSLHPVKVYSQNGAFLGVGKYAAPFGGGTASYEMFGDGRDGNLTVGAQESKYLDDIRTPVAGIAQAGESTLSVGSTAGLKVGDEILIVQMQGTGSGKYEFAQIASVGATTLTVQGTLQNSYGNVISGKVTLCSGGGYTGRCEDFTSSDSNLSDNYVGNDAVESVRIEGNYACDLYREADYNDQGNPLVNRLTLPSSISHLLNTTGNWYWVHSISSVRVFTVPSKGQVIRVPHYNNLTIQAGGIAGPHSWDGETGGIVAMRVAGTLTIEAGGSLSMSYDGFRGGQGASSSPAYPGESYAGFQPRSATANWGGGKAGDWGGGGGYLDTDWGIPAGGNSIPGTDPGLGDLATQFHLGSGGGGSAVEPAGCNKDGGRGAGSCIVYANVANVLGSVVANGAPGSSCNVGAGGGSGGAIKLVV